jgi:hypothetical protein
MMLTPCRSGGYTPVMRIKIVRMPTQSSVDGIRLDGFHPGSSYVVGTTLAALFLAEGWAVPDEQNEPALPMSIAELESEMIEPPDLTRELFLPYDESRLSVAADQPSRRRGRKKDGDMKRTGNRKK